jgi:hypothetical protein
MKVSVEYQMEKIVKELNAQKEKLKKYQLSLIKKEEE